MFTLILLILALVCFIAAAANIPARVNFIGLGLALVTVAWIIPLI